MLGKSKFAPFQTTELNLCKKQELSRQICSNSLLFFHKIELIHTHTHTHVTRLAILFCLPHMLQLECKTLFCCFLKLPFPISLTCSSNFLWYYCWMHSCTLLFLLLWYGCCCVNAIVKCFEPKVLHHSAWSVPFLQAFSVG